MKTSRAAVVAFVTLALAGVAWTASALQEDTFYHDIHAGLFPLCTGCHQGIPENDRASFYPTAETCDRCHTEEDLFTVTWSPPAEQPSNLLFEHDYHDELLEIMDFGAWSCEECHSDPGGDRMDVETEIDFEGVCLSCHEGSDHQLDADCALCHIPLAESGFDLARIQAMDIPVDHADGDFILAVHGEAAEDNLDRCATCHTQNLCTSCHVDTGRDEIQDMPMAPEGMEVPTVSAFYPVPPSHEDGVWESQHGVGASVGRCATCHTSNDCAACHVEPLPSSAAAFPDRDQVVAPGVGVMAHAPNSHESLFFIDAHTTLASTDGGSCAVCHQESFCVECHDGPSTGGYHPPGFVARHSADAFGRENECATCHNTEVFCRGCHSEMGLTSFGRLGAGYHADESLWLLRHGQGARQNLESCVSCHKQSDCTQCHGVLGSFKVSPHSSDFDAERAWERSPRTCLACHIGNPLDGIGR